MTNAEAAFQAFSEATKKSTVIEAVARESGFSVKEILGLSRSQPLAFWRQIAMARCLELGYSLTSIGYTFGRDHTTVICARNRVASYAAAIAENGRMPAFSRGNHSKEYGLAETQAVALTSSGKTGTLQ